MVKKKASRSKKMPEITLFLVCDAVSRDPNSRKLSLYGVFDSFNVDKFPTQFGAFSVVVRLKGGSGRHSLRLEILDTKGVKAEVPSEPKVDADLSPGVGVEVVIQVVGLTVKKSGILKFVMKSGNRRIGKPLEIQVRKLRKT